MATFFFHRPDFVFRNPEIQVISISHQQLTINFTQRGRELFSLERSSFGGPVINEHAELTDLVNLLKKTTEWSLANNISSIQVRCFPEAYDQTQSDLINKAFSISGYEVLYTDVDQMLFVNQEKGMDLSTSPRLHVKKCRELGFQFGPLENAALGKAYDLIADSRLRKNYTMSMDLPDLAETFSKFPDNYFLFGVSYKEKIIAAAVVIKVSPPIWYCFYWGDDLDYRAHSPITFLIYELYNLAKERGVTWLDLGTSSDKGIINPGVFSFKKSLGCQVTARHTFIKRP